MLALVSVTGWSASAPKDGKPAIPPDLFFEYKPVPAGENAIINWRQAAKVEVALNDKQKQTIKFCWTPAAREPLANDLDDLRAWLKRNKEALDLIDASLKKAKAQWPERNPQNPQPELKFATLIRARLFEAEQLAEQSKFEAAVESLEGSLKLAQMGIEGDSALIHYLIACSARSIAQDAVLRLAARKQVPLSLVERLLSDLPSLDSETNSYDKVLRVEFTRDYNSKLDVKQMAEAWSKLPIDSGAFSLFPEDCRRPLKVLLDPSLIALHPNPLNLQVETEISIRHYRIYRTNSISKWEDRCGDAQDEEDEIHTNLLSEIAPLMKLVEDEPLPLSRAAALKARTEYLKIENPVGRIMDCSISGFMGSDNKVFNSRTEREAMRTVLALLIFERKNGVLPEKLSDLVDMKTLKSVPRDFFSGNPILYSRERRIVWSVGADGEDNHGEAGRFRWGDKDAVWQIPELN